MHPFSKTRPLHPVGRPLAVLAFSVAAFVFISLVSGPVVAAPDRHGESALTCTNVSSGANWQIRIDYDRKTVDSNPASFSEAQITWHDAKDGWGYTLDRKSGNLTVVLASATGGNFIYDRCKLEN